jgi:protein TonB
VLETVFHGRPGEVRQIALALIVSLAIHALILALLPGLRDRAGAPRTDPPPLIGRLMSQPIPPALPSRFVGVPQTNPEKTRSPERAAAQPAPLPPLPVLAQPPKPAVEPVVAQVPTLVPAPVMPSARPVTQMTTPALVAKAAPVEPSVPPVSAADTEEIDSASLGQYRSALIAAARRYRKYPRVAVENGWEGRAEVRLTIDSNGSIASIGIRTRSGYEVLDQRALEMIRKAKPMAPVPQALRGKGFTLDLPVMFSLKEETG